MKESIPKDKVVFEVYTWITKEDPRSVYLSGVYAHGEIEDIIGHDIIRIYSGFNNIINDVVDRKEFIIPCFMKHEGKLLNCTFFFWVDGTKNRGLIVLDSDSKYMKDAKIKFDDKRSNL